MGIFLGHLYRNLVTLYITYPLALCMDYISFTATVEFLAEVTYPIDKVILTSLFNTFFSVGIFIFMSIERLVMQSTSESYAVLLVAAFLCLSLFSILFARPLYKRNEVEEAKKMEDQEEHEISNNERAKLIRK